MHYARGGISQACALGSAISAAVLAGAHKDFQAAQKAMVKLKARSYKPNPAAQRNYNKLYALYLELHDAFGGVKKKSDLSRIMKGLLSVREESLKF